MIKFESGFPIPPPPKIYTKYGFGKMKAGESFALPEREAKLAWSAACNYGKQHDCSFRKARMPGGLIRIWKV